MSQENVQIVRKLFAAWNTSDRAHVLELVDPDIVIDATRRATRPHMKGWKAFNGCFPTSTTSGTDFRPIH
jgi:ketosteroid isomerase-like protein